MKNKKWVGIMLVAGLALGAAMTSFAAESGKNREAVAAYRDALLNDPRLQSTGTMMSTFQVADVNQDGVYEVSVYVPGQVSRMDTRYFLYYTDHLNYVEDLEYRFWCIPGEGRVFTDYIIKGGMSVSSFRFDGTNVSEERSYFYGGDVVAEMNNYDAAEIAEQKQLAAEYYALESRGVGYEEVKATAENINRYLTGNGIESNKIAVTHDAVDLFEDRSFLSQVTVPAGWRQDANGWWWQKEDGTWPCSGWEWIDDNNDGVSECYYFQPNGYILTDTVTPDGLTVNASGALVENGVVQTHQDYSYECAW